MIVFVYMAHHHLPLRDLPPAEILPVVAGAAGAELVAAVWPGRAAGVVSAAPSMFINCSNQATGLTHKCLAVEGISLFSAQALCMQKRISLHEEEWLLGTAW